MADRPADVPRSTGSPSERVVDGGNPTGAAWEYRYKLVVEGDDYTLLSALSEVAQVALRVPPGRTVGVEGKVEWTCRTEEEVNPRG